jgi:Ras homolog gene family, member A
VRHYCEGLPVILVGCKSDLRNDQSRLAALSSENSTTVTREFGSRVAEEIGAFMYLECSAKTGEGIYRVFDQAARSALAVGAKKKKSFKCNIQ